MRRRLRQGMVLFGVVLLRRFQAALHGLVIGGGDAHVILGRFPGRPGKPGRSSQTRTGTRVEGLQSWS